MSGCSSHTHEKPSQALPVITVNNTVIAEEALANELQYHPSSNLGQAVQQAGQALVIRQLLLDEADEQGLDTTPDNEEVAFQKLMADSVSYDDPTEDDCERFFASNREKFTTVPLMEVDHILLAAAKDDHEGRDEAKAKAKEIIEQLQADTSLFAELATEFSACPSKETGGSLGQLSKGQTVPEFERQLMTQPEGLATSALESRYGLHVVNVTRKIEGKPLEYSMVADKVRGYLVNRASHLAIQAYIQGLVEKADIDGVEVCFAEENIHI
ncbi:MAG: peptidylprolyl isomerase [Pseudomonadales bacterium]